MYHAPAEWMRRDRADLWNQWRASSVLFTNGAALSDVEVLARRPLYMKGARRMRYHHHAILVGVVTLLAALIVVGAVAVDRLDQGRTASCGAIHYAAGGLISSSSDARQAERCFADAATHCRPATLSASVMGVDTGTVDTLVVEPPLVPWGSCRITLTASHYGMIPMNGPAVTVACRSATLTTDGLRVSGCGSLGDIDLPAVKGAGWPG